MKAYSRNGFLQLANPQNAFCTAKPMLAGAFQKVHPSVSACDRLPHPRSAITQRKARRDRPGGSDVHCADDDQPAETDIAISTRPALQISSAFQSWSSSPRRPSGH